MIRVSDYSFSEKIYPKDISHIFTNHDIFTNEDIDNVIIIIADGLQRIGLK